MATLIEYRKKPTIRQIYEDPQLTTIGYLDMSPEQALRELFPQSYVIDYKGFLIPSRGEFAIRTSGLKISSIPSGIGLTGTVEMLYQSRLFQSCKHEPFSREQRKTIAERVKDKIFMNRCMSSREISKETRKEYALIFEILGYKISEEELVELTTPEQKRDYDSDPFRGVILPEENEGSCGIRDI